jgi:hypothetical protein
MSIYKFFETVFIFAVLLFSLFTVGRIFLNFHLFDFNIYYLSVQDIMHGISPYHDRRIDNNYPPTAFLYMFPFGLLSQVLAEKFWTLISFGAFLSSLWVLMKILKNF